MESIEIKGYKSIRDLKLKLSPINILIGANGSGKSNLLSFFELLKNMYLQRLKEYVALHGGMDKFLFEGSKITDTIYSHLDFGKNGYSFELKAGTEGFVFTKEGLWYANNPYMDNPIDISSFQTESKLNDSSVPRANFIKDYLAGLEKYHFHDTSEHSPFTQWSNIHNDIYRLYDKGQNLAAFLYQIKNDNLQKYNFIVKTVQSIAPYFRDFSFHPNAKGDLRLQWEDRYSSMVYGVNDLSDGTMRFIALSTLFLQPTLPQVIIIDEPELGLHPAAISKLAGLIKSAAAKGCQVIIATQSTELLSNFEPQDVVTVDQINGESHFERLDADQLAQWVDEYTLDELWKLSIISNAQPNT